MHNSLLLSASGEIVSILLWPLHWLSAPFGYPLYEFLRDQGCMISGLLTLIGGAAAFAAARRQAVAVEEQNRAFAAQSVRTLAREKLTAASIMAGVLSALEKEATRWVGSLADPDASFSARTFQGLPLLELQGSLGQMPKEFISEYFELYDRIEVFKEHVATSDQNHSAEIEAIEHAAADLRKAADTLVRHCLRSLGGGHFSKLHRYNFAGHPVTEPARPGTMSLPRAGKSKKSLPEPPASEPRFMPRRLRLRRAMSEHDLAD